jgi:hypothetical protein
MQQKESVAGHRLGRSSVRRLATPPNTYAEYLYTFNRGSIWGPRAVGNGCHRRYAEPAQPGVGEEPCKECTRRNRKLVRGKLALASIVPVGAARTAAVQHSR